MTEPHLSVEISTMNMQERHYLSELEIKYDTGKGWTFVCISAWKQTVNAIIGGVGMVLIPYALKLLNSIVKILHRMMYASFNSNPWMTVIFCYSPTYVVSNTLENWLAFPHILFQKREWKSWTFIYPSKSKAKLDYIFIKKEVNKYCYEL